MGWVRCCRIAPPVVQSKGERDAQRLPASGNGKEVSVLGGNTGCLTELRPHNGWWLHVCLWSREGDEIHTICMPALWLDVVLLSESKLFCFEGSRGGRGFVLLFGERWKSFSPEDYTLHFPLGYWPQIGSIALSCEVFDYLYS